MSKIKSRLSNSPKMIHPASRRLRRLNVKSRKTKMPRRQKSLKSRIRKTRLMAKRKRSNRISEPAQLTKKRTRASPKFKGFYVGNGNLVS